MEGLHLQPDETCLTFGSLPCRGSLCRPQGYPAGVAAGGTWPAGQRGLVGVWAVTAPRGPPRAPGRCTSGGRPFPVCEPWCMFPHPSAGSESGEQLPARTWRQTSKDPTTDHGQGAGMRGKTDPDVSVCSENI